MRCATIVLCLLLPLPSWAATSQLLGIIRADTTHMLFGDFLTGPGDVTGDGYADLLVSTGRFFNYLYRGGPTIDTVPYLVVDSTNPWHSAIGDVNSDGWPDMAIPGRTSQRYKMAIYLGGPSLDTQRDYWFGWDSLAPTTFAAAVDLDLDGHDELVAVAGLRYEAFIFEISPWDSLPKLTLLPLNRKASFAYQPAVGDFNGDGHEDLALGVPMSDDSTANGRVYIYFARPDFDSLPDVIITRPDTFVYGYQMFGTVVVSPGDMNGDGADELFVNCGCGTGDVQSFLYLGGPAFGAQPDLAISRALSQAARAGDLNRDGYADLLASDPSPWSGAGTVYVWYGRQTVDSLPDLRLDNWQYPGFHTYFGRDVVGLGDLNGDGVDDFAFTMYDADTRGLIYIYSGTGQPNDVPYHYEPTLPISFALYQNYPNPFNLTTIISFDLPKRTTAKLAVFNIKGECVTTLLDRELAAGTYRLTWDGRDAAGQTVASGVYLYRLETAEAVQTKKMLLLK